ncbi:Hypothetical predicted protein [Paramuricea clavata]|uniref:Uncharacterized protein n=1 Tax=Paramuricea clavata TaxID=317549 RepID=A0A6S7JNM8_PARCT|nr:Hypothetical predicted protein [Paramuricea clavata]
MFFGAHYMPCEGEPLNPQGDDLMDDISEKTTKEADLDGLTPAILEARYDRKNKVDSWCKCGKCSDRNLVDAHEYRCYHEIVEALGKLTIDGSIAGENFMFDIARLQGHDERGCVGSSRPFIERPKGQSYK